MEILRRRSGTGERGGNLAGYLARFSHPRHNDAPFSPENQVHRFFEGAVKTVKQRGDRLRLLPDYPAAHLQHIDAMIAVARTHESAL